MSILMSESQALHRTRLKALSDSEMAVAAQQLMQLSDHEDSNSSANKKTKNKGKSNQDEVTCKKIEELFGKDDEDEEDKEKKEEDEDEEGEEVVGRRRNRKYRSLKAIYKETKVVDARYAKKARN